MSEQRFQFGCRGAVLIFLCLAGLSCGRGDGADRNTGCLELSRAECRADERCEAIPYWGESAAPCEVDNRGFADNCPYDGCRPQDADCPELSELAESCPKPCRHKRFAVDPRTGCRICECG